MVNTPICFPKNSPKAIPKTIGSVNISTDKPFNDTPAFAKANIGSIKKETHMCKLCSNL